MRSASRWTGSTPRDYGGDSYTHVDNQIASGRSPMLAYAGMSESFLLVRGSRISTVVMFVAYVPVRHSILTLATWQ